MAEDEHKHAEDSDIAYLKAKATSSTLKTIEAILDQPQIKSAIRRIIVRGALAFTLLLAGILALCSALRQIMNWGIAGDIVLGISLISAAIAYLSKSGRS